MELRKTWIGVAVLSAIFAVPVAAADRSKPDKATGLTAVRPTAPLDTHALNTMLRADRDKDGVLSREELEHYDLGLARRFNEADTDRDGKLTFYEFEKLVSPTETSAHR